jgi:peptidoglycan hydrolase FlgJ
MSIGPIGTPLSADPTSVGDLKRAVRAGDDSPETLRAVARQFESLFAQMLIKSMRATSFGDGLMDSEQSDFYRDMFDQQISVELTQGRGLGLADILMRQLSGLDAAAAGAGGGTDAALAAPGAVPAPREAAAPAVPVAATDRSGSREDFVRALWPHAEAAGRRLGVDPATIVSHAALETGWGRSLPVNAEGVSSFNLFGIKAGRAWRGDAAVASTVEYTGGAAVRQQERFRAYSSLGEGVADYARLLGNASRYSAALNTGGDVAAFANALQKGGYATDPAYAQKLQSVARQVHSMLGAESALKTAAARPIHPATSAAT